MLFLFSRHSDDSIVDLTEELIKELQNLPDLNGFSVKRAENDMDEKDFSILAAVKMLVIIV